jgi:hypothetical protein
MLSAQSNKGASSIRKSFLGNNFNAGLPIGAGTVRPYIISPVVLLKDGSANGIYSSTDDNRNAKEGFEIGLQGNLKVSSKLHNPKGVHETFRKSKVREEYKTRPSSYTFLSKWFNPYWSLGLGLDRAIWTPALGIKGGPFNAKVSIWNDLTAAGMLAVNVNIDIYKLKKWDKKKTYVGLGGAYFNAYSGDIRGSSTDLLGLTANFNRYYVGRRSGLELKAGIGRAFVSSRDYDFDTGEHTSESRKLIVPMVGISYNLYLFKFE